jgi:hypothetical protein
LGIKEWLRRAARASRGQLSENEEPAKEDVDGAKDTTNDQADGLPSGQVDPAQESDRDPIEGQGKWLGLTRSGTSRGQPRWPGEWSPVSSLIELHSEGQRLGTVVSPSIPLTTPPEVGGDGVAGLVGPTTPARPEGLEPPTS